MLSFQYPDVYRDETAVQDYHGHKISDPYAWLEDPDSEQTKAFVEAQNKITVPFLEQCPIRGLYKERMTELYDYPKYSCHFKKGKRYFYFYNTGLQNQRVLYVQDSLEGEARVFLDPNVLSDDGTVALRGYAFSEDGEYFAYGLSASGSDWVTIKFMKVDGAKELPDVLERVKFSCMAWTHDGKGMFYNSYPQQDGKSDGTETSSNLHQKLCYHVLGTDQSEDILCAEFPDEPKWMGGAEMSPAFLHWTGLCDLRQVSKLRCQEAALLFPLMLMTHLSPGRPPSTWQNPWLSGHFWLKFRCSPKPDINSSLHAAALSPAQ
ncbi:prolyl endopeptidase-like, partial [Myotis lucifugus]|uniref:prolyl endopeptidase-like n=1 Tax=Myotis lucifugus TaxID=59463 RepID=UPI000CCC2216